MLRDEAAARRRACQSTEEGQEDLDSEGLVKRLTSLLFSRATLFFSKAGLVFGNTRLVGGHYKAGVGAVLACFSGMQAWCVGTTGLVFPVTGLVCGRYGLGFADYRLGARAQRAWFCRLQAWCAGTTGLVFPITGSVRGHYRLGFLGRRADFLKYRLRPHGFRLIFKLIQRIRLHDG